MMYSRSKYEFKKISFKVQVMDSKYVIVVEYMYGLVQFYYGDFFLYGISEFFCYGIIIGM